MKQKGIAIGLSNFDQLITQGSYYIDKTLLIKELIDMEAYVTLFTRPRRFGKTLNMYMLKSFFEKNSELSRDNHDKRHIFNGLAIEQAGEQYWRHFARYPVIFLSLKDVKKNAWEGAYAWLTTTVSDEFKRHSYLLEKGKLDKNDVEQYKRILTEKATQKEYENSIRFLSSCLSSYYNEQVVIIIDEYDVPLASAWTGKYYADMIGFLRPFFAAAFKDNAYMKLAVLSGCLRVSRESIFTGLNNFKMVSITSLNYSEYFGFTQQEVDAMLDYYGITSKREEIKEWYDGYLFGNTEVYNPWSVINRVSDLRVSLNVAPEAYWVNTSGNDIVRQLANNATPAAKIELETLMAGGEITKAIHEDITYDEIETNMDNLWNFLFFTGYLKKTGEVVKEGRKIFTLKIPNVELHYIYERKVSEWFEETIVTNDDNKKLIAALLAGDEETAQTCLSRLLVRTVSFYDTAENFYHGFVTGLLSGSDICLVKSNRESGDGRSDLAMMNPYELKAIIIEMKIAATFDDLTPRAEDALKQIKERHYSDELYADGYRNLINYGIAFYKKICRIKKG